MAISRYFFVLNQSRLIREVPQREFFDTQPLARTTLLFQRNHKVAQAVQLQVSDCADCCGSEVNSYSILIGKGLIELKLKVISSHWSRYSFLEFLLF